MLQLINKSLELQDHLRIDAIDRRVVEGDVADVGLRLDDGEGGHRDTSCWFETAPARP
jgi:hypothetical protein